MPFFKPNKIWFWLKTMWYSWHYEESKNSAFYFNLKKNFEINVKAKHLRFIWFDKIRFLYSFDFSTTCRYFSGLNWHSWNSARKFSSISKSYRVPFSSLLLRNSFWEAYYRSSKYTACTSFELPLSLLFLKLHFEFLLIL